MTLNDVQEVAQLASTEDRGNHNDSNSVHSYENQEKSAEEIALRLNDLHNSGHQDTPPLQASRDLCRKCNVYQPAVLL